MPKAMIDIDKHLERLINVIRNKGIDCYICKLDSNIKYLTGDLRGSQEGSFLIVHSENGIYLFIPQMEAYRIKNDVKWVKTEILSPDKSGVDVFQKIKELKIRKICFDNLSYRDFKLAKKNLPNVKIDYRPDILQKLRQVKGEEEVRLLIKAAKIADIGMNVASENLRVGMSEYELAAEIEYSMRKAGSEGLAFETSVSSGFRSSYPHGGSTDKKILRGDVVVIDIGARFYGYRSDLTRTYFLGTPSGAQSNVYMAVYEAQKKALENIHNDMSGYDADRIARNIIRDYGYAEYFIHGLGHGVGIDIHEPPRLSPVSKDNVGLMNVLTIEPGIYLPDKFGVRIEDLTLVTPNGLRLLSHAEKNVY